MANLPAPAVRLYRVRSTGQWRTSRPLVQRAALTPKVIEEIVKDYRKILEENRG